MAKKPKAEASGLEGLPAAARTLVSDARAGKAKPAYLFFGEAYLIGTVAQALVDALVPPQSRSLNLEVYDGRSTAIVDVLDSARTPGLFGGAKVIWVREPPMFLPGEKRGDAAASICEAAKDGRMDTASTRLVSLLAAAGWSQEEFDTGRISEMPRKRVEQAFGSDLEAADLALLDELQVWMRDRSMRLDTGADASDEVIARIDGGMPPGTTLVFTASRVDSRKRLVKRLKELGVVLELAVERERSGALKAESATEIIDRVTSSHGKRLAPAARSRLLRLAGGDPAALANEMEKLCLFAGEAPIVEVGDVNAVVRDLGDAWIFDLTDALGNRDTHRALVVLGGLLAAGDHPLRILATLHSQVRLLLLLRECLDGPWRDRWRPGTRADAFTRSLVPALDDEERATLGGIHPYRLAVNTGHAAKLPAARLRRALVELASLDDKFKSSRGDPRILLQAFVMRMCG